MTTPPTDYPQRPHHRKGLGALGSALDGRIKRMQAEYIRERPAARADLARLRRGLGKSAGSVPEIWELTVGAVPEAMSGDSDEPSQTEAAAHAALTLYALHQQSLPIPMHVPGRSFGQAVRRLHAGDERSKEAVARRFMAVATAVSIDELLTHVRGLVTQLRAAQVGLDYARFADDIASLLNPARAQSVRLRWGRDFYRSSPDTDDTATTDEE